MQNPRKNSHFCGLFSISFFYFFFSLYCFYFYSFAFPSCKEKKKEWEAQGHKIQLGLYSNTKAHSTKRWRMSIGKREKKAGNIYRHIYLNVYNPACCRRNGERVLDDGGLCVAHLHRDKLQTMESLVHSEHWK